MNVETMIMFVCFAAIALGITVGGYRTATVTRARIDAIKANAVITALMAALMWWYWSPEINELAFGFRNNFLGYTSAFVLCMLTIPLPVFFIAAAIARFSAWAESDQAKANRKAGQRRFFAEPSPIPR